MITGKALSFLLICSFGSTLCKISTGGSYFRRVDVVPGYNQMSPQQGVNTITECARRYVYLTCAIQTCTSFWPGSLSLVDVKGMLPVLLSSYLKNIVTWFIKMVQQGQMWLPLLLTCSSKVVNHLLWSVLMVVCHGKKWPMPMSWPWNEFFFRLNNISRWAKCSWTILPWGFWGFGRSRIAQWCFTIYGQGETFIW